MCHLGIALSKNLINIIDVPAGSFLINCNHGGRVHYQSVLFKWPETAKPSLRLVTSNSLHRSYICLGTGKLFGPFSGAFVRLLAVGRKSRSQLIWRFYAAVASKQKHSLAAPSWESEAHYGFGTTNSFVSAQTNPRKTCWAAHKELISNK